MSDKTEMLIKFDNSRLIDIVKNHKRYRYDDSIKDTALQILKDRGVDEEMLRLTGNLTDHKYESAEDLFKLFNKNSKMSFIFYGLFLTITIFLFPIVSSDSLGIFLYILNCICIATCIIFIIKSLICYSDFYKSIGKHIGAGTYFVFIMSGIFVYFFMYFYYKKEMKEDMKIIN